MMAYVVYETFQDENGDLVYLYVSNSTKILGNLIFDYHATNDIERALIWETEKSARFNADAWGMKFGLIKDGYVVRQF